MISSHNLRAFAITGAGAVSYVGLCSFIGKRRLLPERLSRKLMHIGTGTLYMLCWPLYDTAIYSPWLCASVPFLASLNFALVGSGLLTDLLQITQGATRRGNKQELLKGPLLYGLVHSAMTVALWKTPAAVISLAVLCGGDGLAEVIGKSAPSAKLPYNKDKVGSACPLRFFLLKFAKIRKQNLLPPYVEYRTIALVIHPD